MTTKATRAAFDRQIAVMKTDEEARGLWCVCGHSSPTHDVGFTCQSVACDCLNFRPSNATETKAAATATEKAAPRPWEVGGGPYDEKLGTYPPIITSECRDIATLETYYGDAETNAALIVDAVNSIDSLRVREARLVEALKAALPVVESVWLDDLDAGKDASAKVCYEALDQIRAALALVDTGEREGE